MALTNLRINVELAAPNPQPYRATVFHGSDVTLSVGYQLNGQVLDISGATATFLYQPIPTATPNVWYSIPCTIAEYPGNEVRVAWTGALDFGALAYQFYVRLILGTEAVYSANGSLRMAPSPGFIPGAVPAPATIFDDIPDPTTVGELFTSFAATLARLKGGV